MARQGTNGQNGSGGAALARSTSNSTFALTSFLDGGNAAYAEQLYESYTRDPNSVDPQWQSFFAELKDDPALVEKNVQGPVWKAEITPPARDETLSALDGDWDAIESALGAKLKTVHKGGHSDAELRQATRDSVRAIMMIRAYRMRGHLEADLDPLGLQARSENEVLHPSHFGFTEADYTRQIFIDGVLGLKFAAIPEMLAILRRTYCGTIGYEFMHISDPAEKSWLQARIEGPGKEISFTREGKRAILNKLIEAEGFEKFIDLKFTGTKRFGLDGGESMIPALEQVIKRGGALGVTEIVFGMAHRGRLNVLSQVMAKPHRAIFHEFKGGSFTPSEVEGSGDVKYHLGASSDRDFDGNHVHLSLTANPSHLEIVDPVVLGKVRAKQDQQHDYVERSKVLPLLIHGDAAFAGQGVIAECFGLSGLKGHRTGGSVHCIINNQIGFTTYPRYSRSSPYPSDVAKMIEAPIFHVNGDDPEAVVHVVKVAVEFRQMFHKPVVIDMFCYRRFGHNEGDEPSFTQPLMYERIRAHPTTLQIYAEKLTNEGVVTGAEIEEMKAKWRAKLDQEFEAGQQAYKSNKADWLDGRWSSLRPADQVDEARRGTTGVTTEKLRELGSKLSAVPEGFHLHKTIQRFLDSRKQAIETGQGIDWATGEALAVLAGEAHRIALVEQAAKSERFARRPIDALAGFDRVFARIEKALDRLMQMEALGHGAKLGAEFAQFPDRDTRRTTARLIDLIGRPQRRPAAVEPIGLIGLVGLLAGLEFLIELGAPRGLHLIDFGLGDDAFLGQLLGIDSQGRRMRADALIHQGLREGGLVAFVVAEAAIAEHVDDHRLVEHLAEFDSDLDDIDNGLGIVAVHMEYRRLDHLRHIRRIGRRARIARIGRKADLVVDDEMHRAASAVALEAREPETFGNDALAGEGRVAVDEQRQHFAALDVIMLLILLGAHLAEHDGIDDLEMRGVGGQRQMHVIAVEVAIRRGAEVIFDVARAFDFGRRE